MKPIDYIYRFDPARPESKAHPRTAAEARQLLEAGNRLFARWTETCLAEGSAAGDSAFVVACSPQDLGLPGPEGTTAKQTPFAVLLGCSDARVPAEIIFGQARNDLFVVRVAGNVLADECLGSVEYALHHLRDSVRIVVVLGHSGCGAVAATVDTYLNPWAYLEKTASQTLRSIVDRILVPVRKSANALRNIWGPDAAQLPGYRETLIETTVFVNTIQVAYNLRQEMNRAGNTDVQVVYGVFDLLTHRVRTAPLSPAKSMLREVILADAPASLQEFEELADRIAIRQARKALGPDNYRSPPA